MTKKNREIIGILESYSFETNKCFFHLEFEDDEPAFKGSSDSEADSNLTAQIASMLKL
ncbi:hypothetical protein [Flavobacterium foetidum]|uniref:hypothetical protein n=1 Tax=Flavobacterium foetidum TaxID=2026681 RepID=UPI0013C34EEB|nr:hypothetical protein [Flavobacterium foetidum]KAF2516661.1 hypothetical protein E0W73_06110 [Flavobacterium foetidum]